MSKIRTGGNWSKIDELDGTPIEDGELLEITWPDGKAEVVKARVQRGAEFCMDHGHQCSIPVHSAYIEKDLHGRRFTVSLVGLEARRIEWRFDGP